MAGDVDELQMLRTMRDQWRAHLARLDELGENQIAIELNSAIEAANIRLGEEPSDDVIAEFERTHLAN
jgi:hypothetical protein